MSRHALLTVPTLVGLLAAAPALALCPWNGETGVCPDTQLSLSLPSPVLGVSGSIRIYDADHPDAPVDAIDLAAGTAFMRKLRAKKGGEIATLPLPVLTQSIGGLPDFNVYPITVSGSTLTIHPRNGALAYGKTYVVRIDPGVFPRANLDQIMPAGWRFSTRSSRPRDPARLTVAADGSGDFCTVQGAVDSVPAGNVVPTTIFIRKGLYAELVCVNRKNALAFVGEDRRKTVIAYPNNALFNSGGGNPYGTAAAERPPAPARGGGYHRGVFLSNESNDLVFTNLTLRNTTPYRGSQAEAIILGSNRAPIARAMLTDVDLFSFQDTLQINGQAYVRRCYLEGDVDFMWGTGPCFFEACECRSVHSGGYYTQVRNPGSNHGYVYLRCTFEGAPGVEDNMLSRIEPGRFPNSEVVLIDCVLTEAVGAKGWLLQYARGTGMRGAERRPPSSLHFWEFHSRDASGRPVDTSERIPASRQLALPDDAETIARYSDPRYVLDGWDPRPLPGFKGRESPSEP